MAKYFFDRVGKNRAEYDYQGCILPSLEEAREVAELIALDLSMESETEWSGWMVDVKDAVGRQFFSVAVQQPEFCAV
jgi:hypothetical protein